MEPALHFRPHFSPFLTFSRNSIYLFLPRCLFNIVCQLLIIVSMLSIARVFRTQSS